MYGRLRFALAASLALSAPSLGQTLTSTVVASGFDTPVWGGIAPGDGRLFVAEQFTGRIRIWDGSQVLATPFLDLGAELVGVDSQQGFLSMAFHPKYAQNGFFYVTYTTASPSSKSFVERYRVSAGDPDTADPASKVVLLEIDEPFPTHNVEHLAFGPIDNYLYLFSGDGGGPHDVDCDAQNPSNLLGKMLRIDVDGTDPGLEYAIPADNPWVGQPGAREEIWSMGLRNVWRFGFDRLTGDLYMGDVGQGDREELDFEPALTPGRNYGWPVMEGDLCNGAGIVSCVSSSPPGCFDALYTDPVHTLDHPAMGVIVGGVVYRGCRMPDLQGTYFFGDRISFSYFSAEVAGGLLTNLQDRSAELSGAGNAVHFAEDADGEILIVDRTNGVVSRIEPSTPPGFVDCDGDGLDDACELATFAHADTDGSGVLDTCETLDVDVVSLCVGAGGTQTMQLHAGAAHAGEFYWILGSLSGTVPGTGLGSTVVPVNLDAYTLLTISEANLVPLVATAGLLDGAGAATAQFDAPAGLLPTSAVGLTASHAFFTVDAFGGISFASNATTLSFEP